MAGQSTDCSVLAAQLLDRPPGGARGQQVSGGGDALVGLGEGVLVTQMFPAHVAVLDPVQPHRPAHRGRVDQRHGSAVMNPGEDPAGRAPPLSVVAGHSHHHSMVVVVHRDHVEPGQVEPGITTGAGLGSLGQRRGPWRSGEVRVL